MKKMIQTNVYGITVILNTEGGGEIFSELRQGMDKSEDTEALAAIDGIESLILAHACAGIDITTPAYLEGIETAVEAIDNNI